MTHDIETVLDNIKEILEASLNSEIVIINNEKSDDSVMGQVDSNAYCFQSLDDEVFNYDPMVLYGVVDIEDVNNGPYNMQNLTIAIVVIASDDADGNVMTRRMFRYQKALKQTIEKNWQKGTIRNKITIESFLPTRIEGLNDSQSHRVVGIEVKTSIT